MLAELVAHVAEAIDRFRGGELDAFTADRVLFQYSRAARELWMFCNMNHVEIAGRRSTNALRSIGESAGPQGGHEGTPY